MPASVTTIASFPTSTGNGTDPDGQLFIDSNGDLRGATVHGGANGIGTTYEIAKIAGGLRHDADLSGRHTHGPKHARSTFRT